MKIPYLRKFCLVVLVGVVIIVATSRFESTQMRGGNHQLPPDSVLDRLYKSCSPKDVSHPPTSQDSLPTIYVITPTYRRPQQIAELTRLSHTLMHVPNLHWLVVEDAHVKSLQVEKLLVRSNLSFSHLIAPMPQEYRRKKSNRPKGVSNRNRGLKWLRSNATGGVFYFADDDNTYDLELFREMRHTKKVSMWPVGLCTQYGVSSPIVRHGAIVGFYDGWIGRRKFPVDMAGFAVSVEFLLQRPRAIMPYLPCFEEEGFLRSLAPFEVEEIELKADNCTKILVWHTQTYTRRRAANIDPEKYRDTNLIFLKDLIV